jgi:hypothetical protein
MLSPHNLNNEYNYGHIMSRRFSALPMKCRINSVMSTVGFSKLQASWQVAHTDIKKNTTVLKRKHLKTSQE